MAKDDYFVVAYQLLKFLYSNLKQGQTEASGQAISVFGSSLAPTYWMFILRTLNDEGYISGIDFEETYDGPQLTTNGVSITVKGIEYLFSNSMMQQVKNTLKDFKDIVPGM